jgi:glycine cleavage system H protein
MIPGELKYTAEHEWIRADEGSTVTVGITHYAQESLGDIVFVSLPSVGDQVEAGQSCGEVESTKSVSELYAPVTGQVTEVNSVVDDAPETINSAPYEAGWLFRIDLGDPSQLDGLLSASEYEAMTQGA